MKKLYTFLVLVFTVVVGNAQIVNIPDANFKAKLLAASPTASIAYNAAGTKIKIDTNSDGNIQVSEALLVKRLYVTNSTIADLTGIESFINLTVLDCSTNQLISLNIAALSSLVGLWCSGNQLTSLNLTPLTNLGTLNCGSNQLTALNVSNSPNLITLDCSGNSISNLNISSCIALEYFYCASNLLTNLDVSNRPNLRELNCRSNSIASLNITDDLSLFLLYFDNNQIQSINLAPFVNIEVLAMGGNPYSAPVNISPLVLLQNLYIENLTNPAVFPLNDSNMPNFIHLITLKVDGSSIGNFNYNLLPILDTLLCRNTGLTNISTIPANIHAFVCENNLLTSLDLSGFTNLQAINFATNPITNLNFGNQPNLMTVYGGNTSMTNIDVSGLSGLTYLSIYNSPNIITCNIKNGLSGTLSFANCPNLQYICSDQAEVTAIQNSITTNGYTNCHVNTYCNFVPGGTFYTIQGNNRYDSNINGCDITDINIPNLKLTFTTGTITGNLIADTTGSYHNDLQAGTHNITPGLENPTYFTVSPATATVTFPTTASPFIQDFCLAANGVHNDLEVTMIPISRARPGFDANYKIIYKNKGTNTQTGSVNLTFDDTIMDLVSASPTNTSSSTNSLSWSFSNLQPFETRVISVAFNINSPTETPAVNGGNVLHYTATIAGATDETPIDNTSTLNQTVVNSLDPNDKTCVEGTTVSPSTVGQYVHYVIRFENTGTANAQNIVVKDMIDTTKYDISSLVALSGSASYVTRITNTNQVEFIFENINLPFDDANNDGYVAFKIKTKPTLVVGDTFSNNANIYFDYNFPITTNTATTTIATLGTQDFEFSSVFSLSPVPAKNLLTITTKQVVAISSMSIYNTLGQLVQVNTNPNETIDVSGLKTGSYFVRIISDKGSASGKFLKE